MAHRDDKKRSRSASVSSPGDASQRTRPQPDAENGRPSAPAQLEPRISKYRSIPLDVVQNIAEYSGCVADLLSIRGVSKGWHGAVRDAVGFLNGRCWTRWADDDPLWAVFTLDRRSVVVRCFVLCLGRHRELSGSSSMASLRLEFRLLKIGLALRAAKIGMALRPVPN
jgi:hypothetical protein